MDRYFTGLPVAKYLLDNKITLVGTMRASRAGIPEKIKNTKTRVNLSTMYVFPENHYLLLLSYVVQKRSGKWKELVLSTMHNDVKITKDAQRKPHFILFYDRTKTGVNVMDMISGHFLTKFKTQRWTINTFVYILDNAKNEFINKF